MFLSTLIRTRFASGKRDQSVSYSELFVISAQKQVMQHHQKHAQNHRKLLKQRHQWRLGTPRSPGIAQSAALLPPIRELCKKHCSFCACWRAAAPAERAIARPAPQPLSRIRARIRRTRASEKRAAPDALFHHPFRDALAPVSIREPARLTDEPPLRGRREAIETSAPEGMSPSSTPCNGHGGITESTHGPTPDTAPPRRRAKTRSVRSRRDPRSCARLSECGRGRGPRGPGGRGRR